MYHLLLQSLLCVDILKRRIYCYILHGQFCLWVSFGGGNKKNEQPSINSANDIAARWSSFCAWRWGTFTSDVHSYSAKVWRNYENLFAVVSMYLRPCQAQPQQN